MEVEKASDFETPVETPVETQAETQIERTQFQPQHFDCQGTVQPSVIGMRWQTSRMFWFTSKSFRGDQNWPNLTVQFPRKQKSLK